MQSRELPFRAGQSPSENSFFINLPIQYLQIMDRTFADQTARNFSTLFNEIRLFTSSLVAMCAAYAIETYGIDPTLRDANGNNALDIACADNHFKLATYLVTRFTLDPLEQNRNGTSPLSNITCKSSVRDSNEEMIPLLTLFRSLEANSDRIATAAATSAAPGPSLGGAAAAAAIAGAAVNSEARG